MANAIKLIIANNVIKGWFFCIKNTTNAVGCGGVACGRNKLHCINLGAGVASVGHHKWIYRRCCGWGIEQIKHQETFVLGVFYFFPAIESSPEKD